MDSSGPQRLQGTGSWAPQNVFRLHQNAVWNPNTTPEEGGLGDL